MVVKYGSGVFAALLTLCLTAAPAGAQTNYWWNAPTGGAGTWVGDGLTMNWSTTALGPTDYAWANLGSERANFGNTGGAVAIDATGVTAFGVNFLTTGYTLSGGTLTLAGAGGPVDAASGVTATINSVVAGTVGLTKTGTGTLVLGAANTFTGIARVAGGTLATGTNNAISTGTRVELGTFTGSAATAVSGAGQTNLNIGANNQQLNSLFVFNSNTTGTPHTITIGSGNTLTVSNAAGGANNIYTAFGAYNGSTATTLTSVTTFTGGGSFVVNTPSGIFEVGQVGSAALALGALPANYPTASTSGSATTVHMQALSSFTATLSSFRVGDFTGGGNAGSTTLNLAPITSITTTTFLAMSGRNNGTNVSGQITINLGATTNTINADTIYIGGDSRLANGSGGFANPRSQASLLFAGSTGDLTIRSRNGSVDTANLFLGIQHTGSGTNLRNNIINVTNHSADISLNGFQVGGLSMGDSTANTGEVRGTFTFNQGTVSAMTLSVGNRIGTSAVAQNNTAAASGFVNVDGGTLTVKGTGATALHIGVNTFSNNASGTGAQATNGTVNVTGGALNVPNGGITLATNTGNYTGGGTATFTTTGTLNITGGTVTVGGDIVKGAATSPGSATATLTLNGAGAVLNMNNHRIGGTTAASAIDVLNLQAGTVIDVLQINNGAGLTKTGTGTLVMLGTNTYTGGTTVSAGTLQIGTGGTSGSIVGDVVNNGSLVFNRSDTVTFPGTISGTGDVNQNGTGTLILTGNNTYTTASGTAVNTGTLLVNGQTGTNSGTGDAPVFVKATGTLGGTGRVGTAAAGAVTVDPDGTLRPGDAAGVGKLTVVSGLTMSAGSNLAVRITAAGPSGAAAGSGGSSDSPTDPTNHNFLSLPTLGSTATFDAGMKVVVDATGATYIFGETYSYKVAQTSNDQSGLNITAPGQFTFIGVEATGFSLTGDSLGGVYLNFTPVPEPATVLAIAAAGLGLGGLLRRRRASGGR